MTYSSTTFGNLGCVSACVVGLLFIESCTGVIADTGFSATADVFVDTDSLDAELLNAEVVMEVQSDWSDVPTPYRVGKLCAASGLQTFVWGFVDLSCPTEATLVAFISPLVDPSVECASLADTGTPTRVDFADDLPRVSAVVFEGRHEVQDCDGPNEAHALLVLP